MSSLLPAIKHLERTFQANILFMTPKMLVLSSVDIYLFSPSEHVQIDKVPSILDKIPNKVILGQTQWSITMVYMRYSFKGVP